jgi:succinyl-diaminopimelate desuccinylase
VTNDGPTSSIVDLLRRLVRTPSQGQIDSCEPILRLIHHWLQERGVASQLLRDEDGQPVAALGLVGSNDGPAFCLDACIDTAPIGDLAAWNYEPTSAEIVEDRIYGRGTADSKAAVAIFAHLAAEFVTRGPKMSGRLLVLFDGDEHTGRFGGVKAFLRREPEVAGVMIGYPGNNGVVRGCRGFHRAIITLYGRGAHSGGGRRLGVNAVEKAADLVQALADADLPGPSESFELAPAVTVTGVEGGTSFSMVPDVCEVRVDMRLTPSFPQEAARMFLQSAISDIDRRWGGRSRAKIEETESWPAYRLPDDSHLVRALQRSAEHYLRREVPRYVAGPSNAGNLLAAHSIEATCGFGVSYDNIHAPNEYVEIETIPLVYRVYRDAVAALLS